MRRVTAAMQASIVTSCQFIQGTYLRAPSIDVRIGGMGGSHQRIRSQLRSDSGSWRTVGLVLCLLGAPYFAADRVPFRLYSIRWV